MTRWQRRERLRDKMARRDLRETKIRNAERAEQRARDEVSLRHLTEEAGVKIEKIKDEKALQALTLLPFIDEALVFMALGESLEGPIRQFSGAVPLYTSLMKQLIPPRWTKGRELSYGQWNASILANGGDKVGAEKSRMLLMKARHLPRTEYWRLMDMCEVYRRQNAVVQEVTTGFLFDTGRCDVRRFYFRRGDHSESGRLINLFGPSVCSHLGSRMTPVGEQVMTGPVLGAPDVIKYSGLMDCVNFYLCQRWSIEMALGDSPSIRLPVDPTALRSMFMHRGVPAGYSRRKALLHWVVKHWRTDRHSPADEIYVRKHLRGGREFEWFGFDCRVRAPLAEAENLALAEERTAMPKEATRRKKASVTVPKDTPGLPAWLAAPEHQPVAATRPAAPEYAALLSAFETVVHSGINNFARAAGIDVSGADSEATFDWATALAQRADEFVQAEWRAAEARRQAEAERAAEITRLDGEVSALNERRVRLGLPRLVPEPT